MSKVCVVLSGAGHLDGGELRESIFTLLCLDQKNYTVDIYAPDKDQHHVINHLTSEEMDEKRNVLVESARIARGDIRPLRELNPENYKALILPGGFGVAKNLSDYASSKTQAKVDNDLYKIIHTFFSTQKVICAMCIAPAILALALRDHSVELTIGSDEETSSDLESLGAKHIKKSITDIHIDKKNKIITTAAYMYGTGRISNVFQGISKAIDEVDNFLNEKDSE